MIQLDLTTILAIIGILFGGGGFITAIVVKRVKSPSDETEAEKAANDLIFRLLDRADVQIKQYETTIEKLQGAMPEPVRREVIGELKAQLQQVTQERDRLQAAISHLRAKAQRVGVLSYAEIVVWATNALDPSVPLADEMDPDVEHTQTRSP